MGTPQRTYVAMSLYSVASGVYGDWGGDWVDERYATGSLLVDMGNFPQLYVDRNAGICKLGNNAMQPVCAVVLGEVLLRLG